MRTKRAITMKKALLAGAAISVFATTNAAAQLDTITVTATKREQSEQDVALSLETVSGQRLQDYNINDLRDLSGTVPNFVVTEGITANTITIRGVGTGQERSFEQAVAMFIDGVYMPRSRQYRSPFFDVERIEVVRGPQAVLFGLNATAGAVSIVTARTNPGDEFTARAFAEFNASHGGVTTGGVIGGSLGDQLGVRLAAQYRDGGGYYENTFLGREEGDVEDLLLRGTAIWTPTDSLTVEGKIEYADFEVDGFFGEIFGGVSSFIEIPPIVSPADGIVDYRRSSNGSTIDPLDLFAGPDAPGTYSDSLNYSVKADLAAGDHTITLIAARSEFDYNLITDLDTTYLSVLDAAIEEEYEQTSVELRVASPVGQTVEYIFGGYYQDWQDNQRQPNIFGPDAIAADTGVLASSTFQQGSELFSVFGSLTYNVTDAFRVTGGARWVTEDKNVLRDSECNVLVFSAGLILPPGALAALCPDPALDGFTSSRSSDNFLPEGVLQYDVSDNVMFYGRVGKGAKAGGFSSATNTPISNISYDDETVLGYEIGMKALIGDIAELNATVFRSRFKDLQVNSFLVNPGPPITTIPVIDNAAVAISQGFEVDGRIAPTDWLTLGGAVAYLDAEFDNFPAAPCNTVATPLPSGFCDISGMALPFAAEWSGNVYADINTQVANDWDFFAGASLAFSSEYFTEGTLDPNLVQDDYTRLSARIGFEYKETFRIEAIGTNLTNEVVLGTSQPFGTYFLAYPEPPRVVSIRASINY